jgi:hypothetical protein
VNNARYLLDVALTIHPHLASRLKKK